MRRHAINIVIALLLALTLPGFILPLILAAGFGLPSEKVAWAFILILIPIMIAVVYRLRPITKTH